MNALSVANTTTAATNITASGSSRYASITLAFTAALTGANTGAFFAFFQ